MPPIEPLPPSSGSTRCIENSRRSRRPRPRPHRHPRPRAPPTPPSALLSRCPHPRAAPRRSRRCACVTCTRACVVRWRGVCGAAHSETPSTALAAVAPASFAWPKTIDGPLSGQRRPNSSEAGRACSRRAALAVDQTLLGTSTVAHRNNPCAGPRSLPTSAWIGFASPYRRHPEKGTKMVTWGAPAMIKKKT